MYSARPGLPGRAPLPPTALGGLWWVQSDDPKVENIGNALFARIGLEERLRDWAIRMCIYGDLFVQPVGRDGVGIVFIDDSIHPGDMDRVDINGRLEGFLRTDFAQLGGYDSGDARRLESPWSISTSNVLAAS